MIHVSDEIFRMRPELYDAMIDWPQRLANERPMFESLLAAVGARRVLDAACGTGRHATMFHSMGLETEGADASEAMIAHCRSRHPETDTLRWVVRSYTQRPSESFDAVVCVGNSLALAEDLDQAERAVRAMLSGLRSGGLLFVQVLNIWRLEEGPTTWQKCRRLRVDDHDVLLIKGVHRSGDDAYIDLVGVLENNDEFELHPGGTRLLGFEPQWFEQVVTEHGGGECSFYGDYQCSPFVREKSADLIVVAHRK
ncbi:MAG: methyltransferase domain-containing protein [Planctomycetota bacterium]|nr:MAG: methyltransferase domain-containing protein [Planctomycetota bacterium]